MAIEWAVVIPDDGSRFPHVLPWQGGKVMGAHILTLECPCNPRIEDKVIVHGLEN